MEPVPSEEVTYVGLAGLVEREFEAVIFDMDGTLIDSTPAVERAWALWAEEHGLTPGQFVHHHGVPSAGIVRALLPEERHAAAIERIEELELADMADIVVLPGAAQALEALRAAKNAIATSCTIPLARARIAAAELAAPSVLVTADDVRRGKPAPDPFLEAARRLGADPRHCLVVEDAPNGLLGAQAAGCSTLAVVTTSPERDLVADGVVRNLADVRFTVASSGWIRIDPAT